MIGKTISHYKITEKLGSGGMGIVYRAEDTKLKRIVALKFLPPSFSFNDDAKQRFIHEAQAASSMDHNNICTIYEIGETADDQLFISMPLYVGETLRQKIEKGPLKIEEVIEIAVQISEGLSKAHEKDIIHRDIKPANIFITNEGAVKILDFGLAKVSGQTQLTQMGSTVGTVAYMSPEQTKGESVDNRTDIWSLGVVLFEMLTGQLPFKGDYEQAVIFSIMNEEPNHVSKVNSAVPKELEEIVSKALRNNHESRYSSVAEMLKDLKEYQENLRALEMGAFDWRTFLHRISKPGIVIPAVIVFLCILLVSFWLFNRQAKIHWAEEQALPEIESLIKAAWWDYTDAYALAEKAEQYIPDDPRLVKLFSNCSFRIFINTEPAGAKIFMKKYMAPNSDWEYLGISPIKKIRLPIGIFRWKMEKEGFETILAASSTWDVDLREFNAIRGNDLNRVLDKKDKIPSGMVRVLGAQTPMGNLDDFFIDKYEVTNKQYKEFIKSAGYRNREYWRHEFIKDGKVLTWEEAMSEFVDQTGRPGPANWQAGDYPDGQGNYPVSGISWYEAAAYAEFFGKTLPTNYHWGLARGESTPLIRWPQLGGFAVLAPFSNFNGKNPVQAGSLFGISSYGAYDMAGNVREWCWNKTQSGRLIRGGAWNDVTYMFGKLSQAPAFDRSLKNGFRCALYPDPEKIPESMFGMADFQKSTNFYKEKPVSDAIFQVYKEQFSYDKIVLNSRLETRNEAAEDWNHERITFDAAYGDERIIAHLFLPKNTDPPYQTVVYFPGSGSAYLNSSEDLEDYYEFSVFLSFILKSGRAVLYPVYKGTFERRDDVLTAIHSGEKSHRYTEYIIQLVKDFKRSIDYLESRQDIAQNKIAYYGMSWGGRLGTIIPAVEERIKTAITLAGGLRNIGRPEVNQINYISRTTIPFLMLNGKYDSIFPYETSIKLMFELLGTPDEHKELKLYETDHIPPRNEIIKETLAWLDHYLGKVK